MHDFTTLLRGLVLGTSLVLGCSSSDGGSTTDSGNGTGTIDETGGGTCTLASTCLGAFFGTCFDTAGTCTASGTTLTYSSGAKMTKSGTTWSAAGSGGAACFTIDETATGYTYHAGTQTLVLTYEGNQARFVCPDGSKINFTASAFGNSDCARFVPSTCAKK